MKIKIKRSRIQELINEELEAYEKAEVEKLLMESKSYPNINEVLRAHQQKLDSVQTVEEAKDLLESLIKEITFSEQ